MIFFPLSPSLWWFGLFVNKDRNKNKNNSTTSLRWVSSGEKKAKPGIERAKKEKRKKRDQAGHYSKSLSKSMWGSYASMAAFVLELSSSESLAV
jgi:predicted alpha/beta superfamily hydrolase